MIKHFYPAKNDNKASERCGKSVNQMATDEGWRKKKGKKKGDDKEELVSLVRDKKLVKIFRHLAEGFCKFLASNTVK